MELGILLTTVVSLATFDERLAYARMPAPTKEQLRLVELMGDDDWRTREKATKKLAEMGYEALRAKLDACRSPDPEVANRARRITSQYFAVKLPNKEGVYPSIFRMDPVNGWAVRGFVHHQDQAKDVYHKVWAELDWGMDYVYMDEQVGGEVTRRYVRRLILYGVPHADIEKALDELEQDTLDYSVFPYTGG